MEDDVEEVRTPCSVCGTRLAVLRAGFLYCMECGSRAAQSQPRLEHDRDVAQTGMSQKSLRKKNAVKQYGNMWSTWHAHNMILAGLTRETAAAGASESALPATALRLWSQWLRRHRIAFFALKPAEPHMPLGFKPRDLELFYGHKKYRKARKKQHGDSKVNRRIQAMRDKGALVRYNYEKLKSTQDDYVESQNLEDLKRAETKSSIVKLNKTAKKHFQRLMTPEDLETHATEGYCHSLCNCFSKKRRKCKIYDRINYLSLTNLYAFLYLALRINNDDAHLGDVLRWCREGHVSYGYYKHLFPDDMTFKRSDRMTITNTVMSHSLLREVASRLAKYLKLSGIFAPNIRNMVKRYLRELELPDDTFSYVNRLIDCLPLLNNYWPLETLLMPNYEGIALGYIIVTFKFLFGMNGESENNISVSAAKINEALSLERELKDIYESDYDAERPQPSKETDERKRLFVLREWMKYIEYRKVVLSQCHYPTAMRLDPGSTDNPELFLHHKKITKREVNNCFVNKKPDNLAMKSLLECVDDNYTEPETSFPIFSSSLTPNASYTRRLLSWEAPHSNFDFSRDILQEDFARYNISFFIRNKNIAEMLSEDNVKLTIYNYNSNCDMKIDERLLKFNTKEVMKEKKQLVTVIDCTKEDYDKLMYEENIQDCIEQKEEENFLDDVLITLKPIEGNFISVTRPMTARPQKKTINLNLCFKNYWLRHYPSLFPMTRSKFESELDVEFPSCFSWLLKECAAIGEMTTLELYNEVCSIEKNIVAFEVKTENKKKIASFDYFANDAMRL